MQLGFYYRRLPEPPTGYKILRPYPPRVRGLLVHSHSVGCQVRQRLSGIREGILDSESLANLIIDCRRGDLRQRKSLDLIELGYYRQSGAHLPNQFNRKAIVEPPRMNTQS
jgi:hypothetical protein